MAHTQLHRSVTWNNLHKRVEGLKETDQPVAVPNMTFDTIVMAAGSFLYGIAINVGLDADIGLQGPVRTVPRCVLFSTVHRAREFATGKYPGKEVRTSVVHLRLVDTLEILDLRKETFLLQNMNAHRGPAATAYLYNVCFARWTPKDVLRHVLESALKRDCPPGKEEPHRMSDDRLQDVLETGKGVHGYITAIGDIVLFHPRDKLA